MGLVGLAEAEISNQPKILCDRRNKPAKDFQIKLKIKLQMKLLEKVKTNKTKKQLTTSTRRHENGTQKRHI